MKIKLYVYSANITDAVIESLVSIFMLPEDVNKQHVFFSSFITNLRFYIIFSEVTYPF